MQTPAWLAREARIRRDALLRHVIVPAALPTVMVGFRLAFAGAWAAIVAALGLAR